MCDWMGRFSGGTASRWKSRSEINVRTLAAATVAITNSPCHQDRDSFGTISRTDIMRSEAHRQTLLITPWQMIASRTEKFLNPTQMCSAWLRRWGEPDRAIAALQKLLSIPYNGALAATLTPALLRLDPMFD